MIISIITVTFNSSLTIRDTLKSVKIQTYPNIEHIIIDGVSKDTTLKIVKEFPHISKILSERDSGIYDAMNKGIGIATGDIIGILNSDDVFASNDIIEQVVNIFNAQNNIDVLYGNISYFHTENPDKVVRFWKAKSYYPNFFEDGEVPPHPALFVRKKVYDEVGFYKTHYKIAADYEFMLRILKIHQYNSYFMNKTIVKMRLGGASNNGLKSYILGTKELKNAWEINSYDYPLLLYVIRPLKKIKQIFFRQN